MTRKALLVDPPAFVRAVKTVGDYPLAIYLSLSGSIHYLPEVMSVYRIGTSGSWTIRIQRDRKNSIIMERDMIKMLDMADAYSKKEHHDFLMNRKLRCEYNLCMLERRYKDMFSPKFQSITSELSLKEKLKYRYILRFFPFLSVVKESFIKSFRHKNT